MKLSMKLLNVAFYSFICVLALLTVHYAIKWYSSDSSGEAGFAIIAGTIIPILFYVKNAFVKTIEKSRMVDLEINITKKNIRCYKRDIDYAIHLEIELYARIKSSIKELKFSLREPCGWSSKFRDISFLPKLIGRHSDLLRLEHEQLSAFINECERVPSLPIVINESEHLIFTIAGNIQGERLPDGWEGLMLSDWELVIEYNDGKYLKQVITLDLHDRTLKEPSAYRAVGFTGA